MESSKYLKENTRTPINWMKHAVFFMFFLALFCSLINRAASPMLYLLIAVSLAYMFVTRKIRVSTCVLLWICFLLYTMLACFWSPASDGQESVVRVVIKYVLFAFCLYNVVETKEDCEKMLRTFLLAGLCFSVFSIWFYGMSKIIAAIQSGERLGAEICGINPFGMYSGLTVALCLYFATFHKKHAYYALSLLPLILVFSTSSRKALLFVICAVFYFLTVKKIQKSFLKGVLLLAIILVGVLLILQLPAFEQIWLRLQIFFETTVQGSTSVDESTEMRIKLVEIGMKFFRQQPLIGYGTNAFRWLANQYFTMSELSAHNNYVDILTNFGLIGFSLYYIFPLGLTWKALKGVLREIPVFYCALFILVISFVLLDMSYVSYHFIVPYFFFTLFARMADLHEEELQEKIIHYDDEDELELIENSKYIKH